MTKVPQSVTRGKMHQDPGEKILHPRGKRFYYRVLFMFHDVKYTSLDVKRTFHDVKHKIYPGGEIVKPGGKKNSMRVLPKLCRLLSQTLQACLLNSVVLPLKLCRLISNFAPFPLNIAVVAEFVEL